MDALELRHVSKRYGRNVVLTDVNLTVEAGTLHSIVGENGAGKSTLLNIIHGVEADYEGEIRLFDAHVRFKSPVEAITAGISKLHQEIQVVPELTVGENIGLGLETGARYPGLLSRRHLYARTDALLDRLGCRFRSTDKAGLLTVADIQMVAIAKALFRQARVISLDEPTAPLSEREAEILFGVIRELRSDGITILYVSHRLDEVIDLSDQITVLRDGVLRGTWARGDIDKSTMIEKMVGRDLGDALEHRRPAPEAPGPVALEVSSLESPQFHSVGFQVRKGQILGLYGLVGAGRTEVAEAVFGAHPARSGTIAVNGRILDIRSPGRAMASGIALVPEDRKRHGFIRNLDNKANMYLPLFGLRHEFLIRWHRLARHYQDYRSNLNIRPDDPDYPTAQLSGGNQQKLILGKWLGTDASIFVLDEPTKGIDIGAKAEIYSLIRGLADAGKAIVMISSELPEVLGLADRVLIMREGRVVIELHNEGLDEQTVLAYAMGATT